MQVLLLDNIDSFVWNLAQGLGMLGAEVTVRRSNAVSLDDLRDTDLVVLSPGPGRPEDAGICVEAVRELSGTVPIFGVCLGHQAIALALGAQVDRCSPMHGMASPVAIVQDHPIFRGLTSPFAAGRYHSLAVPEASIGAPLRVLARADDGVVMAIAHESHPTWGVQFHPESFLTREGQRLLGNVLGAVA